MKGGAPARPEPVPLSRTANGPTLFPSQVYLVTHHRPHRADLGVQPLEQLHASVDHLLRLSLGQSLSSNIHALSVDSQSVDCPCASVRGLARLLSSRRAANQVATLVILHRRLSPLAHA